MKYGLKGKPVTRLDVLQAEMKTELARRELLSRELELSNLRVGLLSAQIFNEGVVYGR